MAGVEINKAAPAPPNPYVWSSFDYRGAPYEITFSVPWDVETGELQAATATRHPDCMYKKIYFGVGGDGSPEGGHVINVASGSQNIPAGQLHAAGLEVITDITNAQVTAGP